jgi:prepilin-type N-terminal cleavage/methylation domain-containing protein
VEGFTLLESLIALAVVTMTLTMLARVHVQTLRAEAMSQALDGARLRMETVVSDILLGSDPLAIVEESRKEGWLVRFEPGGMGGGNSAYPSLTVAASNYPSAAVVVYMSNRGVK